MALNKEDAQIIQAIRCGTEDGFRLLMRKYQQPVYWHIRRLVVTHDDAQDATQETFIRVFRSFSQFQETVSFKAWIFRIATNEALRLISQRKQDEVSLSDDNAEANSLAADGYIDYHDLEAITLQKAILSLPTKQQLAFNLRYYNNLSYKEIAEATGSNTFSVKVNYHLAKEKIIKFIKNNK